MRTFQSTTTYMLYWVQLCLYSYQVVRPCVSSMIKQAHAQESVGLYKLCIPKLLAPMKWRLGPDK